MKKTAVILGAISMVTLCLAACGKPNMSFEDAVDAVSHSEIGEMMANAENYEQNFSISSNFSLEEDNVDASISFSTNSKQNVKDSEWESKISIKIDASWDGDEWRENIKIDWEAMIKYLKNAIYFELSSLDIQWPEDFDPEDLGFDLDWIVGKWFSFELTEEMINEIKSKLPEDFDFSKFENFENKENLQKIEEDLLKFKDELKKSIINEGALVYSGIYSEFDWYNAYRFSIDKEKVFVATTEYIKTFIPEEYMEDYLEAIEEIDLDEVFEDFPLTNFEWYLVITWKNRVQVVIENLDIEDYYSTTKINGTFGRDRYEIAVHEDDEEMFIFSAKLTTSHYDVIMRVDGSEVLKWTITPKKSRWKISLDFDLSMTFGDDEDKVVVPLQILWSWEEISKFKVEVPNNSKNLLEDIMASVMDEIDFEDIDPEVYEMFGNGMGYQSSALPMVAGWILAASMMPRMQSAQDRARDVARKNDLSQLQTAIITSQQDKWVRPGMNKWAKEWITVDVVEKELIDAGMYSVPTDPESRVVNYWLGENYRNSPANWKYLYLVAKRNWVTNAGFVLMAKTEVEWSSNRVVCRDENWLNKWYIINATDLSKVRLCNSVTKWDTCWINNWACTYTDDDELRYILLY